MTDKTGDTTQDIDLDEIEALCEAAHVDMLGGMFTTANEELQIYQLWYPDGDFCGDLEENLGMGYFWPKELTELFAVAPALIPRLVAELRASRARVVELDLYNAGLELNLKLRVEEVAELDGQLNKTFAYVEKLESRVRELGAT